VDLGGLFASTDLSERLKEKNNPESLKRLSAPLILGDEYSFIVMTDTHIEEGNAHGLEKLKDVIKENNETEGNPEIKFVVFCGDLTQNGSEQDLKEFLNIADSLPIPAYPAIGNHDIYFGNWPVWKKLIGSTSYRVKGGSADLFILDSANSFWGKDQLDWLENELKSANGGANGRVFVFSHHNLFADDVVNIQQMSDTRETARLISLVRGKRGIMFTGHSHKRLVKEVGGSLFINIEDFISSKTYCLVSVTKTGVSYEFKNLNNK
jgi:3',5'-cyclic AMP phosphodiesterase CpdA